MLWHGRGRCSRGRGCATLSVPAGLCPGREPSASRAPPGLRQLPLSCLQASLQAGWANGAPGQPECCLLGMALGQGRGWPCVPGLSCAWHGWGQWLHPSGAGGLQLPIDPGLLWASARAPIRAGGMGWEKSCWLQSCAHQPPFCLPWEGSPSSPCAHPATLAAVPANSACAAAAGHRDGGEGLQ